MNMKDSHMAREIDGQPEIWLKTYQSVLEHQAELTTFLNKVFKINGLQIILTGAGTSAFIGEILEQPFCRNTGIATRAIPTTDLVTHPGDFLQKQVPTLLVSFARSGDSPESTGTFELAEKLQDIVYHLVITCNRDGKLAQAASRSKNSYLFFTPEETNDQALAMTSSFTSMTLAGLLISDIRNLEKNEAVVRKMSEYGRSIIDRFGKELNEVAALDFKRVVFLGSGALKGGAKESHLKVLEMTDGEIFCQYDSFLGFRHGPKAIIDETTLLVYLFSGDPYVYSYEIDLVRSINQNENFLFSIGMGQGLSELGNPGLDMDIDLCYGNAKIPDEFFSVCSVLPAQLLGLHKSIALGLIPDSPSQNGGINRIVQGVTIYPY